MTTLDEVYKGAENLINQLIRQESTAQGHTLTGHLEESLTAVPAGRSNDRILEGFAVNYTQFVNDGFPATSASMKQFPFLYKYFLLRGLDDQSAKGAAAATIKKWMKEGMPTQSSKSYSSTGSRLHMIEAVFTGKQTEIDEYITNSFDFLIDENFQDISKNETN